MFCDLQVVFLGTQKPAYTDHLKTEAGCDGYVNWNKFTILDDYVLSNTNMTSTNVRRKQDSALQCLFRGSIDKNGDYGSVGNFGNYAVWTPKRMECNL